MATVKKKPIGKLSAIFPLGVYLTAQNVLTREEMQRHLNSQRWKHYVYGLCVDEGLMFYVGKGTGMRALHHEGQSDKSESRKNAAIKACGSRLRYSIIACCETDNYAAGLEAMILINNHDVLTNIAPGSYAAIERMHDTPSVFGEAMACLRRTYAMVAEMQAANARDVEELVLA